MYMYMLTYMYVCVSVQVSEHHDEAMHEDGPNWVVSTPLSSVLLVFPLPVCVCAQVYV